MSEGKLKGFVLCCRWAAEERRPCTSSSVGVRGICNNCPCVCVCIFLCLLCMCFCICVCIFVVVCTCTCLYLGPCMIVYVHKCIHMFFSYLCVRLYVYICSCVPMRKEKFHTAPFFTLSCRGENGLFTLSSAPGSSHDQKKREEIEREEKGKEQ